MYLPVSSMNYTFCLGIYSTKTEAINSFVNYFLNLKDSEDILKLILKNTQDERIKNWKDIVEYFLDEHLIFKDRNNNYIDFFEESLIDYFDIQIFQIDKDTQVIDLLNNFSDWILSDNSKSNHIGNILKGISTDCYISDQYIKIEPEFLAKKYRSIKLSEFPKEFL